MSYTVACHDGPMGQTTLTEGHEEPIANVELTRCGMSRTAAVDARGESDLLVNAGLGEGLTACRSLFRRFELHGKTRFDDVSPGPQNNGFSGDFTRLEVFDWELTQYEWESQEHVSDGRRVHVTTAFAAATQNAWRHGQSCDQRETDPADREHNPCTLVRLRSDQEREGQMKRNQECWRRHMKKDWLQESNPVATTREPKRRRRMHMNPRTIRSPRTKVNQPRESSASNVMEPDMSQRGAVQCHGCLQSESNRRRQVTELKLRCGWRRGGDALINFTARMCYSEHSRAALWHVCLSQFFWSSHISWLTCHVDSSLSDGCDFHIAQQDQNTFIALISASHTEEVTFISLLERKDVRRCWVTNCTSCWDRKPHCMHIFLSCQCSALDSTSTRTCVWLKTKTWLGRVARLRACLQVIHSHSMFHRPLLDVPDPLPSFCSTPPQSTPNSLLMTGTRRPFCATSPRGLLFDNLAESSPPQDLHGSQQWAHADQQPLGRNSFNIENNDLITTVAFENFDCLQQHATASRGPQQVPASVVNPWLSADMWSSTRKLVRGNESIASVEGTLSRRRRDRDLEGAQTLSERRKSPSLSGTESWIGCSRRIRSSETIIWGWSRHGHKKLGTKKCWYSDSKRQDKFMWRIENEKQTESRAKKKLINWGITKNLLRRHRESQTSENLMNCLCNRRGIPRLWVSCWLKFRIYRTRRILWPIQENFTTLRQRPVHFPSKTLIHPSPRGMLCRSIQGIQWVFQETFLKAYFLEDNHP